MKKPKGQALAWLLFVIAGIVSCGITASGQSVAGVVRNEHGKPVRNANVSVERAGGTVQLTSGRDGTYSSATGAAGGHIRITVAAKGYDAVSAETTAPKDSPGCEADLTLQKHRRGTTASPGTVTCKHATPYAAMLQFRAAFEPSAGTGINPAPGMVTQFNSHIEGGNTISSMWINGAYIFQTKPPARMPLLIQIPGAPSSDSWTMSDASVASVFPRGPDIAQIHVSGDGQTDLLIEKAGQIILRVRVQAMTTEDTWQVKLFRATDKGDVIWQDGSFGDQ